MDVRILSIPQDSIEEMEKVNPSLAAAMKYVTIPAGTYNGQTEDVLTSGFITAYTVNEDVSDDAVYAILETIYQHSSELEEISTSGAEYTLEGGIGRGLHDHSASRRCKVVCRPWNHHRKPIDLISE